MVTDPSIQRVRDLYEFEPRYYAVKSAINVVFGAAIGAYIGFQFVDALNDRRTFWALFWIVMVINGYVLGLFQLGSSIVGRGLRKSLWQLFANIIWLAIVVVLAEYLLKQGWIFAGIMVPWTINATAHAIVMRLAFVKFDHWTTADD